MARRTWGIVEQKQVAARQGWRCNVCQELLPSSFQLDHIVPLSCSGSNDVSNAQALCGTCHADKTQQECLARTQRARVAVVAAKLRAARESTMEDNPFAQFAYLPGVCTPQPRSQHSTTKPATASKHSSKTTASSRTIGHQSLLRRARQTTPYKPAAGCVIPNSTFGHEA